MGRLDKDDYFNECKNDELRYKKLFIRITEIDDAGHFVNMISLSKDERKMLLKSIEAFLNEYPGLDINDEYLQSIIKRYQKESKEWKK